MKLFALALVGLVKAAADFECVTDCYRDMFRAVIKCDQLETEAAIAECSNDAFRQFWYVCLEGGCGAIMPDGTCDARCTPTLEEEVKVCDDAFEGGELDEIEYYKCVMGPGGPAEKWESCFADCTCEMPWCNCTPPETAALQTGYSEKLSMRDTTIICYN